MTNALAELRDALEPLFDSIPLMPVTLSGEQVLRIVVASRCLEAVPTAELGRCRMHPHAQFVASYGCPTCLMDRDMALSANSLNRP